MDDKPSPPYLPDWARKKADWLLSIIEAKPCGFALALMRSHMLVEHQEIVNGIAQGLALSLEPKRHMKEST